MLKHYRKLRTYLNLRLQGVPHALIVKVGANFACGPGFFSRPFEKIQIHNNVFIGRHVHIAVPCIIKDDVMIASFVAFVGGDHKFGTPGICLSKSGREEIRPIFVEEDVWIGHGSVILSGVKIGRGAIIAAGSVLTKDVPPCTIYGGNPAVFIKNRFNNDDDKIMHLNYLSKRYEK